MEKKGKIPTINNIWLNLAKKKRYLDNIELILGPNFNVRYSSKCPSKCQSAVLALLPQLNQT